MQFQPTTIPDIILITPKVFGDERGFFMETYQTRLFAENRQQLWVPPGFAHGFYVLSEWAEVLYKATDFYSIQWERSILQAEYL